MTAHSVIILLISITLYDSLKLEIKKKITFTTQKICSTIYKHKQILMVQTISYTIRKLDMS